MKQEYNLRHLNTGYSIPKWIAVKDYYKGRNGLVYCKTAHFTYDEAKQYAAENNGKYRIYKGTELIEEIG